MVSGDNDKIEIMLNWGSRAGNLDLHTMQINKEKPGTGCETFFNKMTGCENTRLDQDKFDGGTDGGEKITISNPTENLKYTYMVYVIDNSPDQDELELSEAHIDITDGSRSLAKTIPRFTESTPSGASVWFVGCLRAVGSSFEFAAVDSLSRESPYITQKLYCDNLFKKNTNIGKNKPTDFCENVHMNVRLQTMQTSAFISQLDGCSDRCITAQIVLDGKSEESRNRW